MVGFVELKHPLLLSRVGSTVGSIGSGNNLQVSDSNSNLKTASIVIRPLSRKDIFYSRSIYNVDDTSEANEKVSECMYLCRIMTFFLDK